MKIKSDIGHFPSSCGTCPNKNRYVLPNCLNDECARARTRTRNRSAKPGCEVSTWLYCQQMSVAISCHEEKSIVLPDGNMILPPDRLAVKPRYRLALAIVLLHTFLVRFVFHFPLLGRLFTGRRWETTTDICQQYSHVVTSHRASCVALQLRGTPPHACAFAKKKIMADQKWRMAEQN